jgi:isopentenyldiphosphate isomerase
LIPTDPAKEIAVLVDESDKIVGAAPRAEVRARKLLHRGIAVLCTNSKGEIYVHRRTASKDIFPSLYDMFVGGLVSAGESYADCARRELEEELGIANARPEFLFKHLYLRPDNPCWTAVFRICWDGPVTPQRDEISWGTFMSVEELNARIRRWAFVPDGQEVYRRYQRWLRSSQSSG